MSLFFDYKVNLQDEQVLTAQWSNSEYQPLLAVGTQTGKIILFQEEGDRISTVSIQRSALPTKLQWHPYLAVLFICWDDGVISLFNEDDRTHKEERPIHGCRIAGVSISPDGTRMVTGDEHGVVAVWSTSRGLSPICQYHKEGAITTLTYCALATEDNSPPSLDKMNTYFFFGGNSGSVYLADDLKRCSEVCKVGGQVRTLLYYREENSIVIITSSLLLVQFRVSPHEKLVPTRKVKLTVAGNQETLTSIWAGPGLIATVSGENMIRLWNLEQDKNYFLTLADADMTGKLLRDKVVCVAYHEKKKILAGGTAEGRVVMWKSKFLLTGEAPGNSDGWEAQLPVSLTNTPIGEITWAGNEGLLSAQSQQGVSILSEAMLHKRVKDDMIALQISNNSVEIRRYNKIDTPRQVSTRIRVKGMDVTQTHLVVWNGQTFETHTIQENQPDHIYSFEKKSFIAAAHTESVIISGENQVDVCNFQGSVKQTLPIHETEGEVVSINILGDFMVVATENFVKIYDLSRREVRQIGMPRKFEDKQGQSLGLIRTATINSTGNKVALLVDQAPKPSLVFPDTNIYIYDTDIDNFTFHDFGPNQIPIDASWDPSDPRLLVVETEGLSAAADDGNEQAISEAVTLFVTTEFGIKKQDAIRLEQGLCALMGVQVPYIFFVGKDVGPDNLSGVGKVVKRTLRDFQGLENTEEAIRKAILNFSFYLTAGNMDEAFKSVRTIQNVNVWEKMCQMSVKTKRLDVAEICLGNMRFARGAKAVRESKIHDEPEAQLAMVAIQLNMLDEAEQLYRECGRNDLLNEMLYASGKLEEALEIAEKYDRINLKSTHHKLGKYYESIKDYPNAIEQYELSGSASTEVPRMMYNDMKLNDLERYVNQRQDPRLFKWQAQFQESQGNTEESLKLYRSANDLGSVVRVYTVMGDLEQARQLCNENETPLGCFYLAKHLETQGEVKPAIQMYAKAGRFHPAVRLAKENKLDGEVMALSLQSGNPQLLISSARYFEEKHLLDRAVVLFHKGKSLGRALEICLATHNYDYLRILVDDIKEGEDPEALSKAAEYFMKEQMYEKAVQLFLASKQYSKALETCLMYNVRMDDQMVDKVLPEGHSNDPGRKDLIMRIATLCKRQGNFQLACKLFTKAGEKMKGFKCLLKLGDVEKITYYAQMAKNQQIYIFAANFLQNTNWHANPDIMKSILIFYSKAKAWDSLANFFDACASAEIDEHRDYDKAQNAMREALKYLSKSRSSAKEMMQIQFQKRLQLLEQFAQARVLARTNPQEMVKQCHMLLQTPDVDQYVRIGDVYAQLIEYFYSAQDFQQALNLLNNMKQRRITLNMYLDQEMVDNIYTKNNISVKRRDEDDVDEFQVVQ